MLTELSLQEIIVESPFWREYLERIRTKTIPFQFKALDNDKSITIENENKINDFEDEKSNALENLRIAAGISAGAHYGTIFQDSDVYKWLEAVAYSLQSTPDPKLQKIADSVVDLIWEAQDTDGYIDTYFQIREPKLRYRMLYYSHELYCMGHLLEAAVAYNQATGNMKIVQIAEKIVDNLDKNFGYEEGKIRGADGHPEIEIGLLKLYELTGNKKAIKLAKFFLDIRGENPKFYRQELERNQREGLPVKYPNVPDDLYYLQAYARPKDQRTAEGHAVRMLYLAAGMARLVRHNGDKELLTACEAIWENVIQRRMYITAGVGSTITGEAFTGDYDLPNDTMYCETCASVALVFFAYEMFKINPKTEYMDIIERALYNGILAGASLDGIHFFYVNPMEVHADICEHNPGQGHVKYKRPEWYSCACCPPNYARTIGSVQRYLYTFDEEGRILYANLFCQSEIKLKQKGIYVIQKTNFPYDGEVSYEIKQFGRADVLEIRIPYWTDKLKVSINNKEVSTNIENGYLRMKGLKTSDTVTLNFEMPVMAVKANQAVPADTNRVAVQRGPFIFCAEQIDNEAKLTSYRVSIKDIRHAVVSLGVGEVDKVFCLKVPARIEKVGGDELYVFNPSMEYEQSTLSLIPYYAWANRGSKEMIVWLYQMET